MKVSNATAHKNSWAVVVADDDEAICTAVVDLLGDDERFRVVASAASGDKVADYCRDFPIDVAIVDVQMPTGGVDAVAAIHAVSPQTKVIIFTARRGRRMAETMLEAGALGVIHKGTAKSLNESLAELLSS